MGCTALVGGIVAHYALLDENNIVTNVFVGEDEDPNIDWELEYSQMFGQKCLRTSYNMYGGKHKFGGQEFRKNYAIIGGIYDEALDAFYETQPYSSWTLNTDTCLWEAPTPQPNDLSTVYRWNEDTLSWEIFRVVQE